MNQPNPSRLALHQIVMLVLSVYVVLALLLRELLPLKADTRVLLDQIDTGICFYFLYNFGLRLYQAPDKLAFMRWGWTTCWPAGLPSTGGGWDR